MTKTFLNELGLDIKYSESLSLYTTFQLGGPSSVLINCRRPEELIAVIQKLAEEKQEYILIGGGSNIVVSDKGLDCIVVRYVSQEAVIDFEDDTVLVSGSTLLDDLAKSCAESGLSGINCATGIPGTVGGAVAGNAGAFGRQIGDVLSSIELLDKQGNLRKEDPKNCGFSYRHSSLKEAGDIVVACSLSLKKSDKNELLKEREEILALRRSKHPNLSIDPCAGSFFRNVEPTSSAGKRQAAGWFLDQAGALSLQSGGAKIFPKHANIIVKGNACSSQDVYELQQKMHDLVKQKFSIDLVREVRFCGEFAGEKKSLSNSARFW